MLKTVDKKFIILNIFWIASTKIESESESECAKVAYFAA